MNRKWRSTFHLLFQILHSIILRFQLLPATAWFSFFFILLMQLQRQSIRVVEENHLLAGVIIHADWLTFHPNFCQFHHPMFESLRELLEIIQKLYKKAPAE